MFNLTLLLPNYFSERPQFFKYAIKCLPNNEKVTYTSKAMDIEIYGFLLMLQTFQIL